MVNHDVKKAFGQLKMEHRSFGLMIDELEGAINTLDGVELLNAMEDIGRRYNHPMA